MDKGAARELRALIEADLRASGAETPEELRAALNASLDSLLDLPVPEAAALPLSEADVRECLARLRVSVPKVPD